MIPAANCTPVILIHCGEVRFVRALIDLTKFSHACGRSETLALTFRSSYHLAFIVRRLSQGPLSVGSGIEQVICLLPPKYSNILI